MKATPFLPYFPPGVVGWIDVFGYAVPLTWGEVSAEYRAIRHHAAMMDFSMLLKYDVRGAGAIDTVNKVFSRDVSKLSPGRLAYGAVVSEQGRMVDDCTVFLHGPDHVRIIGVSEKLGEFLRQNAEPGVSIVERRPEFAHLAFQGPATRSILQRLTRTDLGNAALPFFSFREDVQLAGINAQVSRLGFTGELGYELMVPADKAGALWAALMEADGGKGLLPFGQTAIMIARIEAGLIVGGFDYTEDTTPFECGMGWAIDFNKRPFQGQSALRSLRESARAQVVTLVYSSAQRELSGSRLLLGGTDVGGAPMVVVSPYLRGKQLGMATVKTTAAAVGTKFSVAHHPGVIAEVVKMPVYESDRTKVRS
jgi:aminomethyltransferase